MPYAPYLQHLRFCNEYKRVKRFNLNLTHLVKRVIGSIYLIKRVENLSPNPLILSAVRIGSVFASSRLATKTVEAVTMNLVVAMLTTPPQGVETLEAMVEAAMEVLILADMTVTLVTACKVMNMPVATL